MSQNALQYAGGRYLWVALGLLAISLGLYWLQDATTPPSGGTWQGLTLGIVAGLLIFWLNYLGVRKRRYGQGGSLKGWVSAHVYLGTALIGVSLFHSAGQLGWNIHSLFFWLMIAVRCAKHAGGQKIWKSWKALNWRASNARPTVLTTSAAQCARRWTKLA